MMQCPVCHGSLLSERLRCGSCGLAYEGRFRLPALARLSRDSLLLAESFLLAGGNLKELGERLELSYPTVRKRVDAMIEELAGLRRADRSRVEEIMRAMERGEIAAAEGMREIRELNGEL
jgi:hypothetical protein